MKFQTNERELVCLLMALNGLQPEASHTNRKRKLRAYEQLALEPLEDDLQKKSDASAGKVPWTAWSDEPKTVDMEKGTHDYLLEKFGADGAVTGGPYIERALCRFIDRLRKAEEEEKPAVEAKK